jgi:hypothetical protein
VLLGFGICDDRREQPISIRGIDFRLKFREGAWVLHEKIEDRSKRDGGGVASSKTVCIISATLNRLAQANLQINKHVVRHITLAHLGA